MAIDYSNLPDTIQCRGTPGIGDQMMHMNIAHNVSARINKPVELTFHWPHQKKHLHHFEDPETIIERTNYIHTLYRDCAKVSIHHKYTCSNKLWKQRTTGPEIIQYGPANDWDFDTKYHLEQDRLKVVMYTAQNNAEIPRKWKTIVTPSQWEQLARLLEFHGMHVQHLSYRTPIREATWHINTAAMVIGYDGMWHYIARNFHKPLMIASKHPISKSHTPAALLVDGSEAVRLIGTMHDDKPLINTLRERALLQYKKLRMAQLKWNGER